MKFLNFFMALCASTILVLTMSSMTQAQQDTQGTPEPVIENPAIENIALNAPPSQPRVLSPVQTLTGDPLIEDMVRRMAITKPDVMPDQIPSLFFTIFEQNLIADARLGLVARPATDAEIEDSLRDLENWKDDGTSPQRRMGPRELSIGGIIYTNNKDWTVWLNGQKITPKRIPPEIIDIRVSKDSIKLKWFDEYTNQIFPIKMRTHQRFNLDTRIFLPG